MDVALHYAIADLEALVRLAQLVDGEHPLAAARRRATAEKRAAIEAREFALAASWRDEERSLHTRVVALVDKIAAQPVMRRLQGYGLVDLSREDLDVLTDAGRRLADAERDRPLH